ncbi:MAG: hypothetical protein Q7T16_04665 [Candidatus Burarchaeum sp.]|nr:hypothetical protein [Candidatus Burarchaeum sp.]MDO8339921.1 hypothetical protein [Candidatus Burarchaeum sp.]
MSKLNSLEVGKFVVFWKTGGDHLAFMTEDSILEMPPKGKRNGEQIILAQISSDGIFEVLVAYPKHARRNNAGRLLRYDLTGEVPKRIRKKPEGFCLNTQETHVKN